MLNKQSIINSIPLADKLIQQKKYLVANSGTVINRLNSPIFEMFDLFKPTLDKIDFSDTNTLLHLIHEASERRNLENPTYHDLEMDALSEDIGKAVSNHVRLVKQLVKPVVNDFYEQVKHHLDNFKLATAYDKYNIISKEAPLLLNNSYFVKEINKYKNVNSILPETGLGVNYVEQNIDIRNILLNSNDFSDAQYSSFIYSITEEQLSNVVELVFSSVINIKKEGDILDKLKPMDTYDAILYSIIGYLLTNQLLLSDTVFNSSLPLSKYRIILANFRDYFAKNINAQIEVLEHQLNMGIVNYRSVGTLNKTIYVHKTTYLKLLEDTKIEVLLGALATDPNKPYTIDKLKENADVNLNTWNNYNNYFIQAESNNKFTYFKDFLRAIFIKSFSDPTEDEKLLYKDNNELQFKAVELFDKELSLLTPADIEDLQELAIKLICRSKFFWTPGEDILLGAISAGKANPKLAPNESIAISLIQYVTDYICSQLQLK